MKLSRYKLITYVCVITGAVVAVYAQAKESHNTYFLIAGIFLLLFGLMRLSLTIPSKKQDDNDPYRFL